MARLPAPSDFLSLRVAILLHRLHFCLLGTADLLPDRGELGAHDRGAQHHEDDDDDGLVRRKGGGGDVELVERGGEELDDIGAEDGGAHVELAAGERVAAQGDGQDGVHLDVGRDRLVVDGRDAADLDEGGHGHAHTEDHEREPLDERGVQAVEARGLLVDAHGLDVEAQARELEHEEDHDEARDGDEHGRGDGHAGDESAEDAKAGVGRDDRERVVVDPRGDGATGGVEDQRRDHRLHLEDGDHDAVEGAAHHGDDHAEEEGHDDRGRQRVRAHVAAAEHGEHGGAGDGDRGADGDVLSSGGRRDQRHADRENRELGAVVEDGDQLAGKNRVAGGVLVDRNGEERRVSDEVEHHEREKGRDRDDHLAVKKALQDVVVLGLLDRHFASPPAMVLMILFWLRSEPESSPTT